jgi:hypothetical protein
MTTHGDEAVVVVDAPLAEDDDLEAYFLMFIK